MFKGRAIAEVKKLKKIRLSKTAGVVLGFNEISGYLDGRYDKEAAINMLKMNTRRFSKRQMTWFRADRRIEWFDLGKMNEKDIIKRIAKSRFYRRKIWI